MRKTCLLFFSLATCMNILAQNPYVLNGNAIQENCECHTLTSGGEFEVGSAWNKNKINLNQPFDYSFNVFLGCSDSAGADGLVFVLQQDSTALGYDGAGMGFQGIMPSLGVTIDTYTNPEQEDPPYDHIALQANGETYHNSINNLAGPVSALANSDNIEDCRFHILRVQWQPAGNLITVSMDSVVRLSLQKNIISEIFNDAPMVYWGFTASSGSFGNVQKVCTSHNAAFYSKPDSSACVGKPFNFTDSSSSFGNIINWYWNFGDSTTSNLKSPPPHLYNSPGIYNVSLSIEGNDGCVSDTFKKAVTITSIPSADFIMSDSQICSNQNALFYDATTLEVGAESYWYWNFGNGKTSKEKSPPAQAYNPGTYTIKFFVETAEGCASDTIEKSITVYQVPVIDFAASDACNNLPVSFTAKESNNVADIQQWHWNFGDNTFSSDSVISHVYTNGGDYDVHLFAVTDNGCTTDTISKPVKIYATNAYAGNDTTILLGYPYQLHATGGDKYTWSPSTGLNNPFIANPITTLNNDITYTLTASTALGCSTSDTLHLKVVKGPEIYVPGAFTPNGDGKNDRFKIFPVGLSELTIFKIFNRWGQILYASLNTNEGWDGTYNGVMQPAGTYIWFVAAKTTDGKPMKKEGTFVLIR